MQPASYRCYPVLTFTTFLNPETECERSEPRKNIANREGPAPQEACFAYRHNLKSTFLNPETECERSEQRKTCTNNIEYTTEIR